MDSYWPMDKIMYLQIFRPASTEQSLRENLSTVVHILSFDQNYIMNDLFHYCTRSLSMRYQVSQPHRGPENFSPPSLEFVVFLIQQLYTLQGIIIVPRKHIYSIMLVLDNLEESVSILSASSLHGHGGTTVRYSSVLIICAQSK